MNCKICKTSTISKFIDNEHIFVSEYCSECKLNEMPFKDFKIFCLKQLTKYNYSVRLKNLIIIELENNFFQHKFGLSIDNCLCNKTHKCFPTNNICHIFKYSYFKFSFYFCFYQDIILFNTKDIDTLFEHLKKKFYLKFLGIQIKYYTNKTINRIKNLKYLFVKEIK